MRFGLPGVTISEGRDVCADVQRGNQWEIKKRVERAESWLAVVGTMGQVKNPFVRRKQPRVLKERGNRIAEAKEEEEVAQKDAQC